MSLGAPMLTLPRTLSLTPDQFALVCAARFTKAGSAKEPLELIAIEAGPEAPAVSLRRAPSSRAVPRMWPAKMSRFTLRLGTWK